MRKNVLHRLNVLLCKAFLVLKRDFPYWKVQREKGHEMIIVSMTSWTKRISNVPTVIESILRNSVQPNKIVLNLSVDEFPNKEDDLPKEVVKLVHDRVIEIGWQGGNTKAFKKIIPTLAKYPNDAIISIDDDFIYPEDFIETFVEMHTKYPDNPLSGNTVNIFGAKAHCGCASLVKAKFFNQYLHGLLDEDIVRIGTDDVYYTICAALNGYKYKFVGKEFFFNMPQINAIEGISDQDVVENQFKMMRYVNNKCINQYHIAIDEIDQPRFKLRTKR